MSIETSFTRVFVRQAYFVGYLTDRALSDELLASQAQVLFFSPAARANNTTLWAALAHGPVITNLDADSPPELVHDETVFDIDRLDQWPAVSDLSRVGLAGRAVCQQYSSSALAEHFR